MKAVEFLSTSPFTVYVAAALLAVYSYVLLSSFISRQRYSHPLPPGPRGVPLLGYFPFLGRELHSHFAKLATVHGPVFRLQLGSKLCVVVSSASAAREVLRDQDAIFANRFVPAAAAVSTYGGSNISWQPYGPVWRMLRKVCSRDLLSGPTFEAYYPLRRRHVGDLVRRVARRAEKGEAVDVGKEVFVTIMGVITNMLWGGVGHAGDGAEIVDGEFKVLFAEIMALVATPNVSDYFPWMRRFDLQRIEKKTRVLTRRFDGIFERVIDARERSRGGSARLISEGGDFLDVMLRMEEKGIDDSKVPFTRILTKATLMEMVAAGTDTTSSTVEFALAEMMNRPETIREVQTKLDELIGRDISVEESHAMQLPYLLAAIKESLRLHPSVPLLLPHCPSADSIVGGYAVPAGTGVFVNAWAIHHDPSVWENPFAFKPERFLAGDAAHWNSTQSDLVYIPFGSGRRICAGSAMGERMVAYVLAALLHAFDWQQPDGESDINLEEEFGLVLKKKMPLLLVPKLRLSHPICTNEVNKTE